jgi:hypothetical protein
MDVHELDRAQNRRERPPVPKYIRAGRVGAHVRAVGSFHSEIVYQNFRSCSQKNSLRYSAPPRLCGEMPLTEYKIPNAFYRRVIFKCPSSAELE